MNDHLAIGLDNREIPATEWVESETATGDQFIRLTAWKEERRRGCPTPARATRRPYVQLWNCNSTSRPTCQINTRMYVRGFPDDEPAVVPDF